MRFRADLSHYGSEDRASGQPFTEAVSRVSQGTPAGGGGGGRPQSLSAVSSFQEIPGQISVV